jgi:hypothetical protein
VSDSRKREHPDPDWPLFKKSVFGDCCGVCGKTEFEVGPLQKGHIHRHAKGGSNDWDNRIAVCEGCNKNKKQTRTEPRHRPADWMDRFAMAWLHKYRPNLLCNTVASSCYLIPGTQADENKRVIVWDKAKFANLQALFTQSNRPTQTEAGQLVRELIRKAKRAEPTLPGPAGNTQEDMVEIALQGVAAFKRAADTFLKREPWEEFKSTPHILWHIWQREFVDNFAFYEELPRRQAMELAERQKLAAEDAVKEKARQDIEYKREGLVGYLSQLNDDWLADPANRERRDDLRDRIKSAEPEELEVLAEEVSAMSLEVSKWYDEQPPYDPDWLAKSDY